MNYMDKMNEALDYLEEHIFSEQWFQKGGQPSGFKMWVPVKQKNQ